MAKANLFFPTPVWAIQLENYKLVNEEMYNYIKIQQKIDGVGINKSNIKAGILKILTSVKKNHKTLFHLYRLQ